MLTTFGLLIFCHFLADYPLQGDFMAKAKNPSNPIPGVPWYQAMTAHCAIHAGFVFFVTGFWMLAAAEFVAHFAIDYAKCRGYFAETNQNFAYNFDQILHLECKIMWIIILILVV